MSEFRQDIVSGDWIVMAPERGKKPHQFKKKTKRERAPKRDCPFEDLQATGNWPPIIQYPKTGKWKVVLIPNKYPALIHDPVCAEERRQGPYRSMTGAGHHDLLITRDHDQDFAELPPKMALKVFEVFQERYRMVRDDECIKYVSTFANWGPKAGASIYHPHYQMLSLPIVPTEVERSLRGSERYFKKHGQCVHCDILKYDCKEGVRIIAEDKHAVALASFISAAEYEVRIFPRKHAPYFERAPNSVLKAVVKLLQKTLNAMKKKLDDPDYNFYIHTSPLKAQEQFHHYHWHLDVIPKVSTPAGFELSTGVEITVVAPEEAAALFRGT